jgi:hypothetical protein
VDVVVVVIVIVIVIIIIVGERRADSNNGGDRVIMEGKYTINMTRGGVVDNASSKRLRVEVIRILEQDSDALVQGNETNLTGYTRAR